MIPTLTATCLGIVRAKDFESASSILYLPSPWKSSRNHLTVLQVNLLNNLQGFKDWLTKQ